MSVFRLTESALAEIPSNVRFGGGSHYLYDVTSGKEGLIIGSMPFDPSMHSSYQIDPTSLIGLALDTAYVTQVLPIKPLSINLIVDASKRNEHQLVTDRKLTMAAELGNAIDNALGGVGDRVNTYVIGETEIDIAERSTVLIEEKDPLEISLRIADIANRGLTFVISDFKNFNLEPTILPLDGVIAIKVDHILERQLPANVGRISLGGLVEVNTNRPKKLQQVNEQLQSQHDAIVSKLKMHGASVASVIIDSRIEEGFDLPGADLAIAMAVNDKH